MAEAALSMRPGLYRVHYMGICANFVIEGDGTLGACAPVLRKRFSFFRTKAERIGD